MGLLRGSGVTRRPRRLLKLSTLILPTYTYEIDEARIWYATYPPPLCERVRRSTDRLLEGHRGPQNPRATDRLLKGKWPTRVGEYVKTWGAGDLAYAKQHCMQRMYARQHSCMQSVVASTSLPSATRAAQSCKSSGGKALLRWSVEGEKGVPSILRPTHSNAMCGEMRNPGEGG